MITSELSDTEMLNKAIYHKILNEISLLKFIAFEIKDNNPSSDGSLSDIINSIEMVVDEIKSRRNAEKAQVQQIPTDDYQAIIEIISKTAHDISDFANNEMAVIESEIRFALYDVAKDTPLYSQFHKLLEQIEFTQTALNDRKSVNEGIRINYNRFNVKLLFEKWASVPKINNAIISLDIQNSDSEFYGDAEKIKSGLNELVDNSSKHNPNVAHLEICIKSKDVESLPKHIVAPMKAKTSKILAHNKYLAITVSDDGKGIPYEQKNWIFLPTKTTSKEGSGLGLFIIKRTLKEMNGYIIETGEQGARFELYIPYG